jgi:hypothetical protein
MKYIIFLDFYGTITRDLDDGDTPFSPECCKLVDDLCEEFDAKIVITSDSVCGMTQDVGLLDRTLDRLVRSGIKKERITGFTHQRFHSHPAISRAKEIKEWLEDFRYPDISYVIFDDMPLSFSKEHVEDMAEKVSKWGDDMGKFVQIVRDGRSEESHKRFVQIGDRDGIIEKHIEKAREILKGEI